MMKIKNKKYQPEVDPPYHKFTKICGGKDKKYKLNKKAL